MPRLFCFGLGYSASVLARKLLKEGWSIAGTCRSAEKAEALKAEGFEPCLFDGHSPMQAPARQLAGASHILSSIPPVDGFDPVLRLHSDHIRAAAGDLTWMGYLSTIGVYGDCDGAWVDETTVTAPISAASRQRLLAEAQWFNLGKRIPVPAHIFRLPGIYGTGGRSQIDALHAGHAHRIVKHGQVFNRIHVDDLASALQASLHAPNPCQIYNVCDDEPAPAQDVVTYAAELLAIDPPPLVPIEEANLPSFALHFYAECKRMRNDRIKRELGVRLKFPTYREGLRAIAGEMSVEL